MTLASLNMSMFGTKKGEVKFYLTFKLMLITKYNCVTSNNRENDNLTEGQKSSAI